MQRSFAVIRTRGPARDARRPMEDQPDWQAHAVFIDSLHEAGFIVLAGPLAGTPGVLLILRAETAGEVAIRLADDPRRGNGLLRLTQIAPWTLRFGSLEER